MLLYVVYSFQSAAPSEGLLRGVPGSGVGRITFTNMKAPKVFADIEHIERRIREENPNFTNVFLTYWSQLKG
jgi:hypothetical protein